MDNSKDNVDPDFIIYNNLDCYNVHKEVMKMASRYFEVMFEHDVLETRQGHVTFSFDNEAFAGAIYYVYHGCVDFSADNIEHLIEIAGYLQIDGLMYDCDDYLITYLTDTPSSPLIRLLGLYDMSIKECDIKVNIRRHLESVFLEAFEKYVFVRYDYEELSHALANRAFTVENEYSVLEACVLWLEWELPERARYARPLLANVDIDLCSYEQMLRNRDIDTGDPELDRIVMRINVDIAVRRSVVKDPGTMDLIRAYRGVDDDRLAYAGFRFDGVRLFSVRPDGVYDVRTGRSLLKFSFGPVSNTVSTSGGHVYVLSCYRGRMFEYLPCTNEVQRRAYPPAYRFKVKFPPTVTEIGDDGDLVSVGGFSLNRRASPSVMNYNARLDSWTKGVPLPEPLCNHSTVTDGGRIYVIGGYKDNCSQSVMWMYQKGEWIDCKPVPSTKQRHLSFNMFGNLYVLPSSRRKQIVDGSHVYNIVDKRWSRMDSDVFAGVTRSNSAYDTRQRVLYMYRDDKVYYVSLRNFTKTVIYRDVETIDTDVSKFVLI